MIESGQTCKDYNSKVLSCKTLDALASYPMQPGSVMVVVHSRSSKLNHKNACIMYYAA